MEKFIKKRFWIILLVLALLAGCAFATGAIERKNVEQGATADEKQAESLPSGVADMYGELTDAMRNRTLWLYDLMRLSGRAEPEDCNDPQEILAQAADCGILDDSEDMTQPLDRRFVAQTAVRALGYKNRSVGYLADITSMDSDLSTMAYYGYFLPDINRMIHPDAEITAEEYDALLTELDRYRELHGKSLLAFGDSIMYGSGNDGEGIADMIAEKYGMTADDYSVPGAAMGRRDGRGHIRDQLTKAANAKVEPDIILINGGTNDMNHVKLGKLTDGFDMAKTSEDDFTGGFEKTMWTLREKWEDVPVVYIRVHNMNLCDDEIEREFGERAIEIAEKWEAATVDLYNDTSLNTEDPAMSNRYTSFSVNYGTLSDSIHPTALGYAKFYLPLIGEAVANELQSEE